MPEDLDDIIKARIDAAIAPLVDRIAEILLRVEALESRPSGSALFVARHNLETALFSAMRGLSDDEQVVLLETLIAYIEAQGN